MIVVDTNSLRYWARRVEKSIHWFEANRPSVVVPWVVLLELKRQVTKNLIAPDAYLFAKMFRRYYPTDMNQFTLDTERYLDQLVFGRDPILEIPDLLILRSAAELGASLCTNDSKLVHAAQNAGIGVYRCDWVIDLNRPKN